MEIASSNEQVACSSKIFWLSPPPPSPPRRCHSQWLSATAPGIRQADHKEARVACAAAFSSAPWRSPVPEFLPRRPNWVSLLARAASLSRPPPPAGSILGKISAGRGLSPGSVLARLPRETPGRCLEDLGHRSPSGRCGASGCCAVSARAAAAGGPRREQPRAAEPAPALFRGSSEPPRLTGRAPGIAASGAARAAGAAWSGQPRGGRAGEQQAQRRACGCRQEPPLGHLLAPRPPLEDVSGEAHVLPAGAEQDHLGGARAIPEPVPGGLGSLWLGLVSVAGPRVERRGGASRVAMHA